MPRITFTAQETMLQHRWHQFIHYVGGVSANTFSLQFYGKYTEPHRAYHNFGHIEACLDLLKKYVPTGLKGREAIELAIWFHDVVYDTSSTTNEEDSAALLVEESKKMRLSPDLVDLAHTMILATKSHVAPAKMTEAMGYFLDIDMAILGSAPDVYDAYAKAIRKEYGWVPEEAFVAGRKKILQDFLDFEWIYNTKKFRQLFEGEARANLKRELDSL